MLPNLLSLVGLCAIVAVAFAMSERKSAVSWRLVGTGIFLQLLFALCILHTPWGVVFFDSFKQVVNEILAFAEAGGTFVFGSLGDSSAGFVFAFQVLTTIIFFASLMSILYHLGVMQRVVWFMAWVMQRAMGVSGAESLAVAANVFVGQTEAPIVVRPFIQTMTKSELMALMTGGFATIAGGVLVAYVRFGVDAGHLLSASLMSAPAALVLAKLMVPETEESKTRGEVTLKIERTTANVVDAAAAGATDGMKLALNVAAMLIAFVALIAMVDAGLGLIKEQVLGLLVPNSPGYLSVQSWWPGALSDVFGYIFAPLAFLMGVPWEDCFVFGGLLGTKVAVNEFVAYLDLGALIPVSLYAAQFSPRSLTIGTYALCGFANFSSIAIQLGGISGLAPDRRQDLARLGLKAMAGGALASFMTAALAGALITSERSDRDYVRGRVDVYFTGPAADEEPEFAPDYLGRALLPCDEFLFRHLEGSYRDGVLALRDELLTHADERIEEWSASDTAGSPLWREEGAKLIAACGIEGLLGEIATTRLHPELSEEEAAIGRQAFVAAVLEGAEMPELRFPKDAAAVAGELDALVDAYRPLWESFALRERVAEIERILREQGE